MKILFVHQNFPGQFLYLAPALRARGHECLAITDVVNTRESAIPVLRYKHTAQPLDAGATRLGRNYVQMSDRGVTVARACMQLRQQKGYVPDVIFGHSGWGETLFLKEVWPEAKLLIYAEFYYRGRGADVGFDTEFAQPSFDQVMISQARACHLGQALLHADAGVSPTEWQASTYPAPLRQMLDVIHDGVNTDVMRPNPDARFALPDGRVLTPQDEVLTFVNRNLEPYRGYHIFMRALPEVMAARPNAQCVIVGGDEVSYGATPKGEKGWKELILKEVRDRLPMDHVHFMGKIPYDQFTALMQVSTAHAYLTYPFVLSWSMIEAMSAGAHVVASATKPVQEVVQHGINGTLVDFFDVAGWSRVLTQALAEPGTFRSLREAARATALTRYDQRILLPKMIDFVERHGPGR